MRLVTSEVVIEAAPDVVFHHLTDADALGTWIALGGAVSEVREGGTVQWRFANGAVMVGRYIEVDPPRRVVFTYGWKEDRMGVPPASTIVEIDLDPHPDGTLLRLRHRLVPTDVLDDHARGWEHFLGVLARKLRGSAR